jgi:trigger factor
MSNRPEIDLPIKREVRQRCGFGCVICGLPLYEYEHMEEWAVVKRHVASEITLLCNQHHAEKTKGLLTKEMVKKANDNPFNVVMGISKPYLFHFSGNRAEMIMGNNKFVAEPDKYGPAFIVFPILIDRFPFIGFKVVDELLILDLQLFDQNNHNLIRIIKNELVFVADLWDVQFVGKKLTVRKGMGDIILDIDFNPPNKIIVNKAQIYMNGVYVKVNSERIEVMNNKSKITGCEITNIPFGIAVGNIEKLKRIKDKDIFIHVDGFPRFPVPFLID